MRPLSFQSVALAGIDQTDGRDSRQGALGGGAKRLFDIAFSITAIASASLLFAVVALAIRATSPGPVFYRHRRIGRDGRSFWCLKFRTMHIDADAVLSRHLASDPEAAHEYARYRKLRRDPRIVPVIGAFLRRTSLDELPQFINVLRGEMSVVGPRPVTAPESLLYGRGRSAVLSCRPGITGLWQVSGRNELSFDDRVAIDLDYVRNWSFLRDFAIVLRTVLVLATRRGAY